MNQGAASWQRFPACTERGSFYHYRHRPYRRLIRVRGKFNLLGWNVGNDAFHLAHLHLGYEFTAKPNRCNSLHVLSFGFELCIFSLAWIDYKRQWKWYKDATLKMQVITHTHLLLIWPPFISVKWYQKFPLNCRETVLVGIKTEP